MASTCGLAYCALSPQQPNHPNPPVPCPRVAGSSLQSRSTPLPHAGLNASGYPTRAVHGTRRPPKPCLYGDVRLARPRLCTAYGTAVLRRLWSVVLHRLSASYCNRQAGERVAMCASQYAVRKWPLQRFGSGRVQALPCAHHSHDSVRTCVIMHVWVLYFGSSWLHSVAIRWHDREGAG